MIAFYVGILILQSFIFAFSFFQMFKLQDYKWLIPVGVSAFGVGFFISRLVSSGVF